MDYCLNCHRHGVELFHYPRETLKKPGLKNKTFCIYEKPVPCEISLCEFCNGYFFNNTGPPWPALVWANLNHTATNDTLHQPSLEERWRLIPAAWRQWWVPALHGRVSITSPLPEVHDVTEEFYRVRRAIEGLRWKELGRAMDEFMAYPTVRCPWGCSTFIHQVKLLPYADLLDWKSNYCCKVTTSKCNKPGKRHWVDSIQPDFPTTVGILGFVDEMPCRPSIVRTREGTVSVLCCPKHSAQTTERYVHVPDSPTGKYIRTSRAAKFPYIIVCGSNSANCFPLRRYNLHAKFKSVFSCGPKNEDIEGRQDTRVLRYIHCGENAGWL